MIKLKTCAAIAAGGFVVFLAACSHPPLPPPASERVSPTAMVEAIRAARADEAAGKYREALAKIEAALKLSPDAPDILQFRAEEEILLREYPAAEADAQRSYPLGPRIGGLCASNWQTVLEIAESKNDQAGVADARIKRDACHKAGPIRM